MRKNMLRGVAGESGFIQDWPIVTFGSNNPSVSVSGVTAGNLLIMVFVANEGTVTGITGTGTAAERSVLYDDSNGSLAIWTATATGLETTIATTGVTASSSDMWILEYADKSYGNDSGAGNSGITGVDGLVHFNGCTTSTTDDFVIAAASLGASGGAGYTLSSGYSGDKYSTNGRVLDAIHVQLQYKEGSVSSPTESIGDLDLDAGSSGFITASISLT